MDGKLFTTNTRKTKPLKQISAGKQDMESGFSSVAKQQIIQTPLSLEPMDTEILCWHELRVKEKHKHTTHSSGTTKTENKMVLDSRPLPQ